MMKSMVGIFLIGGCFVAGCVSSGQFFPVKPLSAPPYIVVYGRADCSACETAKKGLEEAGAAYSYKDMGNEDVRREVYSRLEEAGLGSSKFLIPVIDVNGNLAIRPSLKDVLARCGQPASGTLAVSSPDLPDACGDAGSGPSRCVEQAR